MALESDLAIRGQDVYALPLWRISACVRALIHDPASQLARALGSDGYTIAEHLAFLSFDSLQIANWQRGKKSPRPKRISPLADKPRDDPSAAPRVEASDEQRVEILDYLAQFRPARLPTETEEEVSKE